MGIVDTLTFNCEKPYEEVRTKFQQYLEEFSLVEIPEPEYSLFEFMFYSLYFVSLAKNNQSKVSEIATYNWFSDYIEYLTEKIYYLIEDYNEVVTTESDPVFSVFSSNVSIFVMSVLLYYEKFNFGIPDKIFAKNKNRKLFLEKFSSFTKLLNNFNKLDDCVSFTDKILNYSEQIIKHLIHDSSLSVDAYTYFEDWIFILEESSELANSI